MSDRPPRAATGASRKAAEGEKPTRTAVGVSRESAEMLKVRAEEEHRSMTGHMEYLIKQDASRRGRHMSAADLTDPESRLSAEVTGLLEYVIRREP